MKKALRVAAVLTLGGSAGAIALAFLLVLLANMDSSRPLLTDVSLPRMFWSSIALCLFTVPITWTFGGPLYLLFRRFHLLRVWICALVGGALGVAIPYSFRLLGFGVSLPWKAILWFVLSGAAGGAVMGLLLRRPTPLITGTQEPI